MKDEKHLLDESVDVNDLIELHKDSRKICDIENFAAADALPFTNFSLQGLPISITPVLRRSHSLKRLYIGISIFLALLILANIPSMHQNTLPSRPISTPKFNTSVVATIIETRNLPVLVPVLLNFLSILPPTWPFKVWCSRENYETLRTANSLRFQIEIGRLNITILPEEYDVSSSENLSRFLTKPWFWDEFEAEYALFFQTDSILCSQSTRTVDDWLGYEWVGSPTDWVENGMGGNGGLSIRRLTTIKALLKDFSRPDNNGEGFAHDNAEDYWYSLAIKEFLGDAAIWPASKLLDQADFGYTFGAREKWHTRPFGYHQGCGNASVFIDPKQAWFQDVVTYCPEIQLILDAGAGKFDPRD